MQTKYIDYAERDAFMERLKQFPENNSCFDCSKKNPKWSSASFGILLCLDCSGKHREYGPQVSFVRSLTLDDWTQKQILSLELGGNKNAADHFKRYGLTKPFDYKSANAQKYKQELAKKIDAAMAVAAGQDTNGTTATIKTEPVQQKVEEKPNTFFETPVSNTQLAKSTSEPETVAPVIDKNSTKAKNFSVEFTSKGGNTGKKGIQAKKITNFDLEGLSLEENETKSPEKKDNGMTEFSLGFGAKSTDNNTNSTTSASNGSESKTSTYASYGSNMNDGKESENYEEKIKKFGNAKSISSDAFYGTKSDEPSFNASKFSGSRSISSAQVFGQEEEEPQATNATVDRLKSVASSVASNLGEKAYDWGGKLKEKAGSWMTKFRTSEWSS